jgi:butyrate kinase
MHHAVAVILTSGNAQQKKLVYQIRTALEFIHFQAPAAEEKALSARPLRLIQGQMYKLQARAKPQECDSERIKGLKARSIGEF